MSSEAKLNYVIATHSIESITPSKEAISLCEQRNNGTISMEEAIRSILQKYGIEEQQ